MSDEEHEPKPLNLKKLLKESEGSEEDD